MTRRSQDKRTVASLVFVFAFLAALLAGGLFVYEASGHSATAMYGYGRLLIDVAFFIILPLTMASLGIWWLLSLWRWRRGRR